MVGSKDRYLQIASEIHHRPSKGSYQGARHTMPVNSSPLRAMIRKEVIRKEVVPEKDMQTSSESTTSESQFKGSLNPEARSSLQALQEVNRLNRVAPPFVHRPNSRYLSSLLVK